MKSRQLDALVEQVETLQVAAWTDSDGMVQAHTEDFEADVPCAVATICQAQLEHLGRQLGGGKLTDWALTGSQTNLYVVRRGEHALVALGQHDDKPTKVAEKIAKTLDQLDHQPG